MLLDTKIIILFLIFTNIFQKNIKIFYFYILVLNCNNVNIVCKLEFLSFINIIKY
jgi:hypothetical protein